MTTLMSIITAQFADANHYNCKTCIPQMPMMRAKEDGARRGSSSQYKEYFVLYAQMRHCMWKRTIIRVYAQIKHSYGNRDMAALVARTCWNALRSRWSTLSDIEDYGWCFRDMTAKQEEYDHLIRWKDDPTEWGIRPSEEEIELEAERLAKAKEALELTRVRFSAEEQRSLNYPKGMIKKAL
jgi:hypothetical protein